MSEWVIEWISIASKSPSHDCIIHELKKGWENLRQLCKPKTKLRAGILIIYLLPRILPTCRVFISQAMQTAEKSFLLLLQNNFPEKKSKTLSLWHWLKEKFLPVMECCTRSFVYVVSSCFAKKMLFPKYGFFSLKRSA